MPYKIIISNIYLKEKNIFVRVVSTQKALWINIEATNNIKNIKNIKNTLLFK